MADKHNHKDEARRQSEEGYLAPQNQLAPTTEVSQHPQTGPASTISNSQQPIPLRNTQQRSFAHETQEYLLAQVNMPAPRQRPLGDCSPTPGFAPAQGNNTAPNLSHASNTTTFDHQHQVHQWELPFLQRRPANPEQLPAYCNDNMIRNQGFENSGPFQPTPQTTSSHYNQGFGNSGPGPSALERRHMPSPPNAAAQFLQAQAGPSSRELGLQPEQSHNPHGNFRPSAMVLPNLRAQRDHPTEAEIRRRIAAGVSPNYAGDHTLAINRPADIPQEQNCSVWISGLPADLTIYELLGAVRDTGRVWASHIRPPQGKYRTCGAKITFFKAAAAQDFLRRYGGPGAPRLMVRNTMVKVEADHNRVAEPPAPEDHTRVLMIYGRNEVINEAFLNDYFSSRMEFQVDEVVPLVIGSCVNMFEWRFGSYRCQAHSAWLALQRGDIFRGCEVTVRFGRDPCDL